MIAQSKEADRESALQALADMEERGAKAQKKFAPGSAQHTLQENRLRALAVATALLRGEGGGLSRQELEKARAPLASLQSKSEKARQKLAPGSWQHTMLTNNLQALQMALPLLEEALDKAED